MNLTLTRLSQNAERTLGQLVVGRQVFATMERPWIDGPNGPGGKPRESCVPKGTYRLQPHHTSHFPNTYELVNPQLGVYSQPSDIPHRQTWGRSAILMHVANRVRDVIGCIGVGKEQGEIGGEPAVLRSTLAMRELDALLNRHSHTLVIL